MELYLIRHAQSQNNYHDMMGEYKKRVEDPALSEMGLKQADALGRHVCEGINPDWAAEGKYFRDPASLQKRGYEFTQLYCSPMRRTLQTARPIAEATGLQPKLWVALHEHGGIYLEHDDERGTVGYPGMNRDQIAAEFPNYELTDDITEHGWWTGANEHISEAAARAIKVARQLRQLAEEGPNEKIAVVSHGTFISLIVKALANQLLSDDLWFLSYNTGITRLDFVDGRIRFWYFNRVDHLPLELMT